MITPNTMTMIKIGLAISFSIIASS